MAYEGAPEPADSDHVLQFKQARDIGALAAGEAGDATAANQTTGNASLAELNKGSTNLATSQVTAGAVATLVAARPTRRSVLIRNNGTGTDEVSVGEATVTTTHGTRLKAGESVPFTFTGLIQVLAITGTPVVTAADEYN